jgi:hypothetical protein
MTTRFLERLKALDQERVQLLDRAKIEALGRANKAVSTLSELGFNYKLIEQGDPMPAGGEPRASMMASGRMRRQADAACRICQFKTSPLHDRRSHWSQEPKRPFTLAELAGKGWQKVT